MENLPQRDVTSVIELTSYIDTTGNIQTDATSVIETTSTTSAEVEPKPE
jgi:hypothetical protein